MIGRIWALIIKELHSIWRDKKSRRVLILPPLLQLFVFAFAATLDVQNVTLGILNHDAGKNSIELIQRIYGSPTFKKIIFLNSNEEVTPFIDNQKGFGVLVINEDFSRKIEAKLPGEAQLLMDGRKSNSTQIVAGYIAQIVERYNQDLAAEKNVRFTSTDIVARNWYNPNLIYYWFNIPGLSGILTMLVALILTALSVAREKELGTFDQLLVSPLESFEITLGKMIPSIFISMVEGSVIIFVGVFIFQIPFTGSYLLLYLSMFIFVCCIVGIGLFVSTLCSTQQQALLGSAVILTPSVILSGFATPIENMPTWLQPFTAFIPLRYYLVIAKGIFLKAMPASIVLDNVWPMALLALATLTGATLFFRKKLQ